MPKYIHIDDRIFSELHLSGNEAIVYALIDGYCKASKSSTYECRIDEVAGRLNLSERSVRYILTSLTDGGYITKARTQRSVQFAISDNWRSAKFAGQNGKICRTDRQTLPDCAAKIAGQNGKICRTDRQTLPDTPYYNNICNNDSINMGIKMAEIIAVGIQDFFASIGRAYIPDFYHETTARTSLVSKLRQAMKLDGWVEDEDSVRTYWQQFLQFGFNTADTWLKEHFDTNNIDRQFNNIYNKIHQSNGQQQQQRSGRADGISDDYIQKQFDTLSGIKL